MNAYLLIVIQFSAGFLHFSYIMGAVFVDYTEDFISLCLHLVRSSKVSFRKELKQK